MNAVERVRENKRGKKFANEEYRKGFYSALDQVQAELENENEELKRGTDDTVDAFVYSTIGNLKSKHEKEMVKLDNILKSVERERDTYSLYKAKWEAVELIFGGK